MLTGGCFCGRVRYEAGGVARSQFRLAGEAMRFRSSGKGTRSFCPGCGTQLTFELDGIGDEIDVTTCSLDEPELAPPVDHTRTSRRLAWVTLADGLPQFRESRQEG